jgi:hypothetical protein
MVMSAVGLATGSVDGAAAPSIPVSLSLKAPPAFDGSCCLKPASGSWLGPEYTTTEGTPTGVRARIDWSIASNVRTRDADAAARAALTRGFQVIEAGVTFVPHVIRGRTVGSIPAPFFLAQRPGTARYELAIALPLHRSVFARVRLHVFGARAGSRTATSAFLLNGVQALAWNKRALDQTIQALTLEGALPPARISLRVRRGVLTGAVRDVNDHPVAGARVALQRKLGTRWTVALTSRTDARGGFVLRRPGTPGLYRVSSSLAGIEVRVAPRQL